MISEELKRIAERLKKQGKMGFFPGATEEEISAFEKEQGLRLPATYREWLLFSDGGELFNPAGIQLYGVAHKPFIDISDDDRPGDDYVVIGRLAMGDPIVFKRSKEEVSIYNHESGQIEEDERYADFFAFLRDLYDLLGIGA